MWKPIQVGRRGPKLSHLAFANDLILFAEAPIDQVEVIYALSHEESWLEYRSRCK